LYTTNERRLTLRPGEPTAVRPDEERSMTKSVDTVMGEGGLGRALIEELRALCPEMPETGIVAGQAVASLILRRLGRPGPIHDIDVFSIRPLQRQWTEERRARPRMVFADLRGKSRLGDPLFADGGQEGYNGALVYSHRCFHARFGQVSRRGLLNLIEYEVEARNCDALALIAGHFDLNCVQVGIDLATGELSFTSAFREYLHTNQLYIANPNTPVASLARLARKTAELGAYCDLEAEGRFAAACALLFGVGNEETQAADFVGEHGYAKLEPYRAVIERWMYLAPVSAFTIVGRPASLDGPDGAVCFGDRVIGLSDDGPRGTRPEAPPWRGEPFRLYRACLNPDVAKSLLERPSACGAIRIEWSSGRWIPVFDGRPLGLLEFSVIDRMFRQGALSRKKLKKVQRVFDLGQQGVLVGCLSAPTVYVRDNVTAESIAELNRFFEVHPNMIRALVGISHEEQLRVIRQLRSHERRGNRWVVGAVETAHFWMDEPVGIAIVRDGLGAFMESYRQQGAPVIEGGTPPGLERLPLFAIRVLRTPEALVAEGETMDHCVGGYAPLLWRPGHYFFSIRFRLGWGARSRSTLLLREGIWSGTEHWSVGNSPPSLANVVAARVLQERLRAVREARRARSWAVARKTLLDALAARLSGAGRLPPRAWRAQLSGG